MSTSYEKKKKKVYRASLLSSFSGNVQYTKKLRKRKKKKELTSISLGQGEVCANLLVQADVPTHFDLVLCLRLFQLLVVVRLQLHQRTKDVLVLEAIFVPDVIQKKLKFIH